MIAIVLCFTLFNLLLAYYLVSHEHGPKKPLIGFVDAALFGIVGVIAASTLEYVALPGITDTLTARSALLVGIIEESAKFLPLALFMYKRPYFDEVADGVIFFGICGMTFGLLENIQYTVEYGSSVGFMRLIMTPLFHTATTGIIGYALARSKLKLNTVWLVVVVFLAMILLHGAYDLFLSSENFLLVLISLAITFSLDVYFFIAYADGIKEDVRLGLSIPRQDRFCSSCGKANVRHYRYCTSCGTHM